MTSAELRAELERLTKALAELDGLLADPNVLAAGSAMYQGERYDLNELSNRRRGLSQQIERKTKPELAAAVKAEQAEVKAAQRNKKQLEDDFKAAKRQLDEAVRSGGDVEGARGRFTAAADALRAVNPKFPGLPRAGSAERPAATGQPTGVTGRVPGRFKPPAEGQPPPDGPPPPATTVTPSGPGGAPGTTGGPVTAATRAARQQKRQTDLVAALQEFFPGYTAEWFSENGEAHFGKDLIDLFRKIADPRNGYDTTTTAGRERIQSEIRGTTYWQTTVKSAKEFDALTLVDQENTIARTKQRLAATYGDVSLDDQTLADLARMVARNGLTGLGEQQAVFTTVFRVRAERPEQATRALEGSQADRIRQLGRAYNFRVSDSQIQSILTGEPEVGTGLVLTEQGLRERLQKYVKGALPQLAEQIDAGLTLEDIGANYRQYAARLLERSEDEINMFEGPFLDAFGSRESGQLSLGEWTQKVKSDPRYGWQFTNQANQQAGDIALTIARAFGKVQ